jgi:PhnB protein
MASVSTYLNFNGKTEAAFNFYKQVFGTELAGPFMRMGDAPHSPDQPSMSEEQKKRIMHVALPILGGHLLMGSDVPESHELTVGNNIYISLSPDTRVDVDRLFAALSEGGAVEAKPAEMFWGDYWGACADKFGIHWMLSCRSKS